MHTDIYIPDHYLQHIEKQLPAHSSLADFISTSQQPLRRSVRVNTLKITVENFMQLAFEKGWQLTPIPWCDSGFWIKETQASTNQLGNSAEHLAGLFYIQEASSMLPVSALFSELTDKNIRVLDMAAAPGSKTTQIAATLNNNGLIVANEYSASRVKILHANQTRFGITHCALTHYDARIFGTWLPETFDAVLLDAPCSGEGTIRKDPNALTNWSLLSVKEMASTQKALIVSAFHALKPNGVMVYSTCTLSQEENQQVCYFLKEQFSNAVTFEPLHALFAGAEKAVTKEGFLHVFPQTFNTEGFFIAKIRKTSSVPCEKVNKNPRKFPFSPVQTKEIEKIKQGIQQSFELQIPNELRLWSRDQEIWLFPDTITPLLNEIKFDRIGVKLAQAHKQGYKWQHEAILALSSSQSFRKVDLSANDAALWYKGQDIRPNIPPAKGEMIVCYQNYPIGIGKWVGNKIKNGLPRALVKNSHLFNN